jgi:hypothetical protein
MAGPLREEAALDGANVLATSCGPLLRDHPDNKLSGLPKLKLLTERRALSDGINYESKNTNSARG